MLQENLEDTDVDFNPRKLRKQFDLTRILFPL